MKMYYSVMSFVLFCFSVSIYQSYIFLFNKRTFDFDPLLCLYFVDEQITCNHRRHRSRRKNVQRLDIDDRPIWANHNHSRTKLFFLFQFLLTLISSFSYEFLMFFFSTECPLKLYFQCWQIVGRRPFPRLNVVNIRTLNNKKKD